MCSHLFGRLIRFHFLDLPGIGHAQDLAGLQPVHIVAGKRLLVGLEQHDQHLLQADTLRFQRRSDARQILAFSDRAIGFPGRFALSSSFRFIFCQQLLVQGNTCPDFRRYRTRRRTGRSRLCGRT